MAGDTINYSQANLLHLPLEARGMILRVVLAGHYIHVKWNLTGRCWHVGLQQWYSDNEEPSPNQCLYTKLFEEMWNDCHGGYLMHPTLQDCQRATSAEGSSLFRN